MKLSLYGEIMRSFFTLEIRKNFDDEEHFTKIVKIFRKDGGINLVSGAKLYLKSVSMQFLLNTIMSKNIQIPSRSKTKSTQKATTGLKTENYEA